MNNAIANSIGTVSWIFAFQKVPIATRRMKPVGSRSAQSSA